MSTADGLLVSSSQIFANDIYRLSIAPRLARSATPEHVDRVALRISRIAIVLVMIASATLAWHSQNMNVALLLWAGIGGMMAAMTGPMFIGVFWRGATAAGALCGFLGGGIVFILLKSGKLPFDSGIAGWLVSQSNNPFACATLGAFVSIALVVLVSMISRAPSDEHLSRLGANSI